MSGKRALRRRNVVVLPLVDWRLEIQRSDTGEVTVTESTGTTIPEAYAYLDGYMSALGGTAAWQLDVDEGTEDGWYALRALLVAR